MEKGGWLTDKKLLKKGLSFYTCITCLCEIRPDIQNLQPGHQSKKNFIVGKAEKQQQQQQKDKFSNMLI